MAVQAAVNDEIVSIFAFYSSCYAEIWANLDGFEQANTRNLCVISARSGVVCPLQEEKEEEAATLVSECVGNPIQSLGNVERKSHCEAAVRSFRLV